MNERGLRTINDNDFLSERDAGLPAYVVGFAPRTSCEYARFVLTLDSLAKIYADRGIPVRVLDTEEHPTLARALSLGRQPAVLVFSFGRRFAGWRGMKDLKTVRVVLEALIAAYEDYRE